MQECDLVMKGGVTSGTVYPKAIVRLAEKYYFRSIGGTSAGAIAAAAAAAAEYRRQSSKAGDDMSGFDELAKLPDKLGAAGTNLKNISKLLELFQPQREFRPLFGMLLAFIGNDRTSTGEAKERTTLENLRRWALIGRVFLNAMLQLPGYALGGVVLSAWLGAAFDISYRGIHLLFAIIFLLGGAAIASLYGLWRAVQKLPENGFGLCQGFEPATAGKPEDGTHLTPWLNAMMQTTAGLPLDKPLTFGALAAQNIELRAVTSNLCYGHPHTLPFGPADAWPFFDEREWSRLFPAAIIAHLKANPPARATSPKDSHDRAYAAAVTRLQKDNPHLFPLPDAEHLPVIVAVRLSLSFPFLLAATPIHMLDPREHATGPARKCWFSDGGISSNFPLHFFDKLIPSRPTFAINLQDADHLTDAERIALPRTNHDGLAHTYNPIKEQDGPTAALGGFVMAIINVMQNWRDNSLLRLPGYRDRVAAVRLLPHEGGLNLSMPPKLITELAAYGERAADELALHFLPENAEQCRSEGIDTTWANHRWTRLLSTLAGLEQLVGQLDVWNPVTTEFVASYSDLLDPEKTAKAPSYHQFTPAQRKLALQCLVKMRDDIAEVRKAIEAQSMEVGSPRPVMRFRLTAEG